MLDRLLSWNDIEKIVPVSKVLVSRLINKCQFPPPIQVGARRVAFRESEVVAWLDAKPRAEWTRGAEG